MNFALTIWDIIGLVACGFLIWGIILYVKKQHRDIDRFMVFYKQSCHEIMESEGIKNQMNDVTNYTDLYHVTTNILTVGAAKAKQKMKEGR